MRWPTRPRPSTTCRPAPRCWADLAQPAFRGEVLDAEEAELSRLDKRLEAETHWLHRGVTARLVETAEEKLHDRPAPALANQLDRRVKPGAEPRVQGVVDQLDPLVLGKTERLVRPEGGALRLDQLRFTTLVHAEQAIKCMRAGKHVEIEIPMFSGGYGTAFFERLW